MDVAQLGIRVDTRPVLKAEGDLKKLAGSARTAETATERLGRASMTAGKSTATAARSAKAMTGAFANTNGIRMAALQLNQVAQQGAITGRYMQALSFQLPDLLMGFGTFGAVAGIAAGALGPLAINLLDNSQKAKNLTDTLDRLADASQSYIDVAEQARRSVQDLADDFGTQAAAAREALRALAEFKRQAALEEVTRGAREMAASMSEMFDMLDRMNAAGGRDRALAEAQLEALSGQLNLTVEQARALRSAIDAMADAQGLQEMTTAGQNLQAALEQVYGDVANMPPELQAAAQRILQAQIEALKLQGNLEKSEKSARVLGSLDIASPISAAAGQAGVLAENMRAALAAAEMLDRKRAPDGTGLGFGLGGVGDPTVGSARLGFGDAASDTRRQVIDLTKATKDFGGAAGGGAAKVEAASPKIQSAVNTLMEDMQQEMEARREPFKQAGQSLLNSLVDGLFSGNMNLGQSLGNIGKQLFGSSLQQIMSPAGGGGIMAGIKGLFSGGLSGMLPGIGMAVGAIGGIFSRMSKANKEAAEAIKKLEEADAQRAAEELEALREKISGVAEASASAGLGFLKWTEGNEMAADSFIRAHGSLDALQSNASFFASTFESDARRFDKASSQVTDTFEEMGLRVVPKTREEFRKLVETLARGGDRVGASRLISIARAFDDMVQGLERAVGEARNTVLETVREQMDAANAMVAARRQTAEDQLARVRVIFDAQADIAERAFNRVRDSLTDLIDAASERARDAADVLGVIQGGLRSRMGVGSLAMRRSRAMSVVNSGDLSDPRALDRAISTLNQPAQNLFRTQAEFQHDFAKTTAALRELERSAETRLSAEERMVDALERQLETETRAFERDNEQRSEMLRQLQLEIEATTGLDLRLQSAIRAIYGSSEKSSTVLSEDLASLNIATQAVQSAVEQTLTAEQHRKAFQSQTARLAENLGDGFNDQLRGIIGVQKQTFAVRQAVDTVKKAIDKLAKATTKASGGSKAEEIDRARIAKLNAEAIEYRNKQLDRMTEVPRITSRDPGGQGFGWDKWSFVYTSDGKKFGSNKGNTSQEIANAEAQARAYIDKMQDRRERDERKMEARLEKYRQKIRAEGGVPSFASGGRHMGGLRLVGEEGPELETTGPSYIHSASQTERMLDNRAVVEELRQLRREVADMHREGMQVQTRTLYRSERQYHLARKWDTEGLPPERT